MASSPFEYIETPDFIKDCSLDGLFTPADSQALSPSWTETEHTLADETEGEIDPEEYYDLSYYDSMATLVAWVPDTLDPWNDRPEEMEVEGPGDVDRVSSLPDKLDSGEDIPSSSARANKSGSTTSFIPESIPDSESMMSLLLPLSLCNCEHCTYYRRLG